MQGSVEGKYHVGEMLLFGAPGIPRNLAVQPNPTEGIRWTFMAATNYHPYACWNMAKALRQGLGTSTNLVAAYAWLKLFSETNPGSIVGRTQMNELALKLDTYSLQQAQNLAAKFKAGDWQSPVIQSIPEASYQIAGTGNQGLDLDTTTGQVWSGFFYSDHGETHRDFFHPKIGEKK